MNRKIISVFIILILALSIGMAGIPDASATAAAKAAYKKVYPNFPDPAPNEPKDCVGLCHLAPWDKSSPILSKYANNLNDLAQKKYGKSFRKLSDAEKQDILKMAGPGVLAQLTIDPIQENIDVGTIGHYKLTLTTNFDAFGGQLTWKIDDAKLLEGLDAAPSSQSGSLKISKHSTCKGPQEEQVCTATFDVQVKPISGITINVLHRFTITAFNQKDIGGAAVVTAGTLPVPELAAGILLSAGIIGILGLARYKKNR